MQKICPFVHRGLKDLIKEAQKEIESQGTVAFSPRTTSLTVVRPRAQKPADERFFEKLEAEVGCSSAASNIETVRLRLPPGCSMRNLDIS